jgi:hypothetical protein
MRSFQENLLILTDNTTNLLIQISELNELREQLRKAQLSARRSQQPIRRKRTQIERSAHPWRCKEKTRRHEPAGRAIRTDLSACIGASASEGRSWLVAIGRDHLSQIRHDFGREHELGHDSPLRGAASSPDKTLTWAHAFRRLVELGFKAKKW